MIVKVQFFKDSKLLTASKEIKEVYKKFTFDSSLIEQGWIDVDTKEDNTYLNLLLHSEYVEIFDGVHKIESRQFRAISPSALRINLGDKIE